jgi:hypothetical protein
MSRFLRFLLLLVPVSVSFALTPHNLHKSVKEVQKELRLTKWHVVPVQLEVEKAFPH